MARKMMSKEVTKTEVRLAVLELVDGTPQVKELPNETLLGNVSAEKAQKELNRKHGQPVTILGVEANTQTFEMEVEEFIKVATVKEPDTEQTSLEV